MMDSKSITTSTTAIKFYLYRDIIIDKSFPVSFGFVPIFTLPICFVAIKY